MIAAITIIVVVIVVVVVIVIVVVIVAVAVAIGVGVAIGGVVVVVVVVIVVHHWGTFGYVAVRRHRRGGRAIPGIVDAVGRVVNAARSTRKSATPTIPDTASGFSA